MGLRYVLAPMAEFTDAAFRLIATRHGADLTYTEMVSAAGLFHGSSPTRHLAETLPGEGPVACQLFGNKPEELAFATRAMCALRDVETGTRPRFVAIDLNAGCPVPRIVKEGSGSALVRDPQRVYDLLRAMVAASTLPVTLKTRPGPHPDRVLVNELLAAAEAAGAAGLTLHARFTSQNHGGPVHLDLLAELVARAKIPITGNGGVTDAATARAMAQTGVAAVMIGRAAVAHPDLFARLKGASPDAPCAGGDLFRAHLAAALAFRDRLAAAYPGDHVPSRDAWACLKLHTHLFRYFAGQPGAAALRQRLNGIRTLAALEAELAACGLGKADARA